MSGFGRTFVAVMVRMIQTSSGSVHRQRCKGSLSSRSGCTGEALQQQRRGVSKGAVARTVGNNKPL